MDPLLQLNVPKTIKTIGKDLEVPWPEELNMGRWVLAKEYRLNTFPIDHLGDYRHDIPFGEYIGWLESYLTDSEIRLTENEKCFAEEAAAGNQSGLMLGWYTGFCYENEGTLRPLYDFPQGFEENPVFDLMGNPYNDLHQEYVDEIKEQGFEDEV